MSILEWFAEKAVRPEPASFEKLNIPGDLWVKCFRCGAILYQAELKEQLSVCSSCGYHFRLPVRDRIQYLFDPDSFIEIDAKIQSEDPLKFTDTQPYVKRAIDATRKTGENDALISGTGSIAGIKVAVALMNFGFMGGSMGSVVGEKITRTIEKAIHMEIPYISVTASGGARMQEGILSLMQMAKTSAALRKLADKRLPHIVILCDPTTGGTTASFAMLGDIHIAEPGALIGFAGQRVIEQTLRQKLPKGFQRAEYLQEHGMVDIVVHRKELKKTVAQVLSLLTSK